MLRRWETVSYRVCKIMTTSAATYLQKAPKLPISEAWNEDSMKEAHPHRDSWNDAERWSGLFLFSPMDESHVHTGLAMLSAMLRSEIEMIQVMALDPRPVLDRTPVQGMTAKWSSR